MNAPTKHKHADLILEHARQQPTGELDAGWWTWEYRTFEDPDWARCKSEGLTPDWSADFYRYTMTDKHPAFVKPAPALKRVDMAKLPIGASVKWRMRPGEELRIAALCDGGRFRVVNHRGYWNPVHDELRIAPSGWIGNPEGLDACPVPEGLRYEVMCRDGEIREGGDLCDWGRCTPGLVPALHRLGEVIFYRILGLAEGWTDEPEAA